MSGGGRDGLGEVLEGLRAAPPYAGLDDAELRRLAARTEVAYFADGAVVLPAPMDPTGPVLVVRSGVLAVRDDGRTLDLLSAGEVLEAADVVAGLGPRAEAVAAEDLLVYLVHPARAPEGSAAGSGDPGTLRSPRVTGPAPRRVPASRPVLAALARPVPVVAPDTPLVDAVRRMRDADASAAVVTDGTGPAGILTDHDLRVRVVAADRDPLEPVAVAMSAPLHVVHETADPDDALLVMLDHGVRHLPVLGPAGAVLGVVEDVDLLAARASEPLRLRRALARATGSGQVLALAGRVLDVAAMAHEEGLSAVRVSHTYAVLVETLVRRLLQLDLRERGPAPAPVTWLLCGSIGRREPAPDSDLDSALVWWAPVDDDRVARWMHDLAARILDPLRENGFRVDRHGVAADDQRFAHPADVWSDALSGWAADPALDGGDIYLAALTDARPVWGDGPWEALRADLDAALARPLVQHSMLRAAVAAHPPAGFGRGLVVDHAGAHRGTLDLKRDGLVPVVGLARALGAAAGSDRLGTAERLAAAGRAGLLEPDEERSLLDAVDFLTDLRWDHQLARRRDGATPDDHLDPDTLSTLTRRYLRDTFRGVRRVQRGVENRLGGRWR